MRMKPIPAVPMPLTLKDWREACAHSKDMRGEFEESIAAYHGAPAAFGTSSGRAALWLALKALGSLRPERNVVILPAYTCPTVGRAVQAAGLQGRCADVTLGTFNINPADVKRVIDEKVLAVIAPHMFGLPANVTSLREICEENDIYLIEDLAQCVGGRWEEQRVGTFGDIAFLSMGRSKNLRGCEGGAVWANRKGLTETLQEHFERLPESASNLKQQLKQAGIITFSAPRLWALIKRVPGLGIGTEDQDFDSHPSKLADWQAALGLKSLNRLDDYNRQRKEDAAVLQDALADTEGLQPQKIPSAAEPTWLRFPTWLEPEKAEHRSTIVSRLQSHNIDVRTFYTKSIPQYAWWKASDANAENRAAENAVERNFILPLYHDASSEDLSRMGKLVRSQVRYVS